MTVEGCGQGVGFAWLSWGFGVPDISEHNAATGQKNGIVWRAYQQNPQDQRIIGGFEFRFGRLSENTGFARHLLA